MAAGVVSILLMVVCHAIFYRCRVDLDTAGIGMSKKADTHYMLSVWGDCRRRGVKGLGYPSQTAESRLLTSPGRSTCRNIGPVYEPNDIERRVEAAYWKIDSKYQLLLWCRYVAEMSDTRIMEFDSQYANRDAARWAVDIAIRKIGELIT